MIKEVYFNELRVSSPKGTDSRAYTSDNLTFKNDLSEQGIIADEIGNNFKFIHLNGAHAPFVYGRKK